MIAKLDHLAFVLKIQRSDLEDALNRIDSFYGRQDIPKLNKKGFPKTRNGIQLVRVLYPSIGKLKLIQKRILKNVLNNILLPDYAHGAVRGESNISNAKKHQGKKYIFSTDVYAFFPYISHKMVFTMFKSHGFSRDVANALTRLTTFKGELPQGAPTSSMLANLVFASTGNKVNDFCDTHGLTFTTFIDDVSISSPSCFKEKIPQILEIITNDGYKISQSKTTYKTKLPKVTGIVVKNNSLDLPKAYKDSVHDLSLSEQQRLGRKNYIERVAKAND